MSQDQGRRRWSVKAGLVIGAVVGAEVGTNLRWWLVSPTIARALSPRVLDAVRTCNHSANSMVAVVYYGIPFGLIAACTTGLGALVGSWAVVLFYKWRTPTGS